MTKRFRLKSTSVVHTCLWLEHERTYEGAFVNVGLPKVTPDVKLHHPDNPDEFCIVPLNLLEEVG